MIVIDNVLVDNDIAKADFACDLNKCKGACCTFPGDSGAPVQKAEVELMKQALPFAKEYLSDRSLKEIEQRGFVEGPEDDITTVCIDKKDCVFVFYDNGIAKCSIEKAYFDGKTDFRKPISCHLFPIRVGEFGGDRLYYEKFSECKPGRARGRETKAPLIENVKDGLIRAYGENWYKKLEKEIKDNYR